MKAIAVTAISLAILLASSASALNTDTPPTSSEDTIDLSPYSIVAHPDLPKPESWRYARIDGFEVLTNASQNATAKLLKDFQLYRQALNIVKPMPEQPEALSTLILCDKTKDFKTFLPDNLKDEYGIVSHLLQDSEKSAIVLDMNATSLRMRELMTQNTVYWKYKYMDVQPRKQLYREYIRYQLPKADATQPPWLLEGVTQVLQDMLINPKVIQYGRIGRNVARSGIVRFRRPFSSWGARDSEGGRDFDYGGIYERSFSTGSSGYDAGWGRRIDLSMDQKNYAFRHRLNGHPWDEPVPELPFDKSLTHGSLMPFGEFLSVTAEDSEALNPMKYQLWANMSHAFVHMCRFGKHKKYKEPLETFAKRLVTEPLSEALFVECFGVNYKKMGKILTSYISYPRSEYKTIVMAEGKELSTEQIVFRAATQAEIARIKGDAQSLAGNQDVALQTYRIAYQRGIRDSDFMAALGVAEMKNGDKERARSILESVAVMNSDRPSVWTSLAKSRLEDAIANPEKDGKLSARQMNFVLAPVLKTLILEPKTEDTFHLIAEAWENSAVGINAVYVNLLGEGAIQFPTDSPLIFRVAKLYNEYGDKKNAAVFAHLGLQYARDDAHKSRFKTLLQDLPPLPCDLQTASN